MGIRQFLRSYTNIHVQDEKENVCIFSLPRSGSTWLMELIWTQPGFKYINEPLNLKSNLLRAKSRIAGFEELYTVDAKDKLIKYFHGFVDGKSHFLDPNPLRRFYRPRTNRIVFKIIHGGELFINDVAQACCGRVIYLLRHPISVALSRKQLPRMDQLCSNLVLNHFTTEEKKYALYTRKHGDLMSQKVLAWCIQNKLALLQRREDWLVFTYEQLVVTPRPIVEKITRDFHLTNKSLIYEQLNIPSAVTVQSGDETWLILNDGRGERHRLVNRWLDNMSPTHIRGYMDICLKMGFSPYDLNTGMPLPEWLLI
jgi:hypothetical protein